MIFVDGNNEYKVSKLDEAGMREYETWLLDNAKEGLRLTKDLCTHDDWIKQVENFQKKVERGFYKFMNEFALESLGTGEGALTLACILFKIDRNQMLELFKRRKEDLIAFVNASK